MILIKYNCPATHLPHSPSIILSKTTNVGQSKGKDVPVLNQVPHHEEASCALQSIMPLKVGVEV
jgi:hypothetical protein